MNCCIHFYYMFEITTIKLAFNWCKTLVIFQSCYFTVCYVSSYSLGFMDWMNIVHFQKKHLHTPILIILFDAIFIIMAFLWMRTWEVKLTALWCALTVGFQMSHCRLCSPVPPLNFVIDPYNIMNLGKLEIEWDFWVSHVFLVLYLQFLWSLMNFPSFLIVFWHL